MRSEWGEKSPSSHGTLDVSQQPSASEKACALGRDEGRPRTYARPFGGARIISHENLARWSFGRNEATQRFPGKVIRSLNASLGTKMVVCIPRTSEHQRLRERGTHFRIRLSTPSYYRGRGVAALDSSAASSCSDNRLSRVETRRFSAAWCGRWWHPITGE